jgi:hypothetical protein
MDYIITIYNIVAWIECWHYCKSSLLAYT